MEEFTEVLLVEVCSNGVDVGAVGVALRTLWRGDAGRRRSDAERPNGAGSGEN
jgi:hypothetical protein